MSRRWISAVAVAATVVVGREATAQLTIGTLAGRQLGDGRAATAASLNRPFGVAFANDGALLIADRRHNRIRRVDPATGVITTIAGSVPGSIGGNPPDQGELDGPLRVRVHAPTGDLLVADFENHLVRRVVQATGAMIRIAGTADTPGPLGDGGLATAAQLNAPADAFPDESGGILIADRNNHKIRRIDALGVINTVAGVGAPGYTGDDVPGGALVAQLNSPACVLPIPLANGGGFFVCDEMNHVIRRVDTAGTITTVAGTGVAGFADGPALNAALNGPVNLAFDADGTLLIVDELNNRLRRLDLLAGTLTTVAGTGENAFTADGEPAATSPLAGPSAVALAPDGRIVFAEDESHRVRAIDAAGNLVTVAGDGVSTFGGDDGPAVDAQLGQIKGVARDLADRFVIADDGNARLRRVDPCTGLIETIAGTGSRAFAGDGGPALEAGLTASDVVVDADGNIVFSDTDNNRVRIVDAEGIVQTLVGTGVPGFAGDSGPASFAAIDHPTGLALAPDGSLYIADFGNHAIRKVTDGIITTVAGIGAPGFNGDGIPANTAALTTPTDVDVDANGNVYIADFGNHRIRRVDPATGLITTIAGTGVAGDSGDGGPAAAARLNQPGDVKVDETGTLWVADFGNHRIRRFTLGGNIATVAGTGLRGYAGDGGPAEDGRLLFPLRLLVLAPDQVVIADRDNFVLRALGTITTDCTKVAEDCTGVAAGTCAPGGGNAGRDCFAEFKFGGPLPSAGSRVTCVDGDPACDADQGAGRCTFRIAVCLNNEDPRLQCTPGAVTSLRFKGKLAVGAGGQASLDGISALASATRIARGRGVAFQSAFADRNRCTPFTEYVVTRGRKKGVGKLNAVVKTAASGTDKDKLKLVCLAP